MGRTPCCDKNGLKKGPWTPEEDEKLTEYIKTHGPGNWRTLPKNAGLQRCGKSCRLRWANYLRPDIKRGRFSFEEEETIIQLHSILGNKWSAIAARLPGRTDNEIKNYWNTHIRKRLLRMGLDPVTHSPRLDLLDLTSLLNSAQLNLTNLLGLQTLVNPEAVRLLATLIPSGNQNPEFLLQKIQENQLLNSQMQNQPSTFQPTQFQDAIQFPPCTTSNASSYLNQTVPVQGSLEQFLMNSTDTIGQTIPQNFTSSIEGLATLPSYGCGTSYQIGTDVSENSAFQSLKNNSNQSSQHFSFDSVLSTPLSSPAPLNSSSTFINSSNTEDERESYCSNMMKFEIPESLDFDSFM